MATFVSTIKFTEQGMKQIAETCRRAEAFKNSAEKMGASVKDVYWTPGPFDGLIVFEAKDEETATALMLQLGSQGNVHTQTQRAYDAAEMQNIVHKLGH